MRTHCALAAAAVILAAAAVQGRPYEPAGSALAECDAMVRDRPRDYAAYRCFWMWARRTGQWEAAAGRLEAILARQGDNHQARLALARVERDRGRPGAERLFREAADGFAAAGEAPGEVFTRLELSFMLRMAGRLQEAAVQTATARAVVERLPDRRWLVNVRVEEGWLAYNSSDLAAALACFRDLEADLADGSDDYLMGATLSGLGATLWATGRFAESQATYRRIAERLHAAGDFFAEAAERYNVALLAQELRGEGVIGGAEVLALQRQALAAAELGRNRNAEASARIALAETPDLAAAERLDQATRGLALARQDRQFDNTCDALRVLAALRLEAAPGDVAGALAVAAEAERVARQHASPLQTARALVLQADMTWRTQSVEEAFSASLAALDGIERIRELQRDELVRARTIASWTFFYHRVVAQLLGRGAADDTALARSFAVMERLRGRVLLDALDAAGATGEATPTGPEATEREDVLDRIAVVQRGLLDPALPAAERGAALAELERLEASEAALRAELARADPAFALLHRPAVPALADVQRALADDQALLAYVVARGDATGPILPAAHGSWVVVVTPTAVHHYPVPDHEALQPAVAFFLGLIDRRDSSEVPGAARLYRDLLADAIDALPAGVRSLVIVPDEALARLPFATLRRGADELPLGARFAISIAPSAALWVRWRGQPAAAATAPAVAFVDPEIGAGGPPPAVLRQLGVSADDVRIGPLPHARREGRALLRSLGGGSRLLVGRDASEAVLKHVDLGRFMVLHLGAHALVDDERPSRSAIVLAAGDAREDGLLQARDIVRLHLEGRLVVLSACRSGGGALLRGEGVMSLARAFFQAGAGAVVASQWPIRDDEAAAFVTTFYRRLGCGDSAATALAAVQRAAVASGEPAAAWASFALWGNGDLVPFAAGRPGTPRGAWLAAAAAAVAALALLVARRRRPSLPDRPGRA